MFRSTLQQLYDRFVRRFLPRKLASFNGVVVRQPRLLDATDFRPEYESALVAGIRKEVRSGDDVVVIGGGWGVSTVAAARSAGSDGHVRTFEGAGEQIERVRETISLNCVGDRVELIHAVVGSGDHLYGEKDGGEVAPEDVPDCDVLVLDCEGAELGIIPEMECEPETIIVETHPMYDAPRDAVEESLASRGYQVSETRMEATSYGDLPVLTATRIKDND
jgi:hypothetical protein